MAFGFNGMPAYAGGSGYASHTPADTGRAASDIKPGSIVRFTIEWLQIQPNCRANLPPAPCTPQNYDWAPLDAQLAGLGTYLQAGQIKLLPVPLRAPTWAQGPLDIRDGSVPYPIMPPGDSTTALTYWWQFVRAMVDHIQAAYPGSLAALEVWNEENGKSSWSTVQGPDPARYTRVLCYANDAVRNSSIPQLPVIFGGMNAVQTASGKKSISDYLNAAYAAAGNGTGLDIRPCMSSIGVHPYQDPTHLVDPSDPTGMFQIGLDQARQAAASHADGGRNLSITEFGYYADQVTPQQQSDWDLKAYDLALGMGDVDRFLIHSLFDTGDHAGVCIGPAQRRIAASALKQRFSGNPSAQATC